MRIETPPAIGIGRTALTKARLEFEDVTRQLLRARDVLALLVDVHAASTHTTCPKHGDAQHTPACCVVWQARMALADIEPDFASEAGLRCAALVVTPPEPKEG